MIPLIDSSQEVQMCRRVLIVVMLSAPLSLIMEAQTTTGSILGNVRDKSGAAIPQAEVTAQNVATSLSRTTTSDETGAYLITNLPVGEYMIVAQKQGFSKYVQRGIQLAVDQNARVDVALAVGDISQSVTVTAESTGVETRSTTIGELVDRTRIQELPLNGRNAMALARVIPGVTTVGAPTAPTNGRNGPRVVVGGARDTQNEFRLDGTSHQNLTH